MSLSEKISHLINPTPVFQDAADDELDLAVTRAKVADFKDEEDDNEVLQRKTVSSLRARNEALLYEEDKRYAGRKTTREKLTKEKHENDDLDEKEAKSLARFRRAMGLSTSVKQKAIKESNDIERAEDSSGSDIDDQLDYENIDDEPEIRHDSSEATSKSKMHTFSDRHLNNDIKMGKAIKNQLKIFDSLLECRIKLQKIMTVVNQLPQYDVWDRFCEEGGKKFEEATKASQENVKELLDEMLELQNILLIQNSTTKNIPKELNEKESSQQQRNAEEIENSDEEIRSDDEQVTGIKKPCSDDDCVIGAGINLKENTLQDTGKKRKLQVDDYEDFLGRMHSAFTKFRDANIEKWSEKTKLSSGKIKNSFSEFELSTLKRIEQILCDQPRLVKRTQMKRCEYLNPGKIKQTLPSKEPKTDVDNLEFIENPKVSDSSQYDAEIFDDNDFYHMLIRELIERKTTNVFEPSELGRQWVQIQNLRSHMKTRKRVCLSNDRSIKYVIHPKLVNFMFPVNTVELTDEARDELYGSLFGKNH